MAGSILTPYGHGLNKHDKGSSDNEDHQTSKLFLCTGMSIKQVTPGCE